MSITARPWPKRVASRDQVLLADYMDYRWLVPEYQGRSYHAHFFMTVGYRDCGNRTWAHCFASTWSPALKAPYGGVTP